MLALALAASLAALPTTVAEDTKFARTGTLDEVEAFCSALPKAFPKKVRCDTFGTTPEGRPMRVLVASDDGVLTAAGARQKKRTIVLAQGGIHAGEIDGKDAGLALLRDMLSGKALAGVLSKVTFVFVPVYNVDGFARFGKNQRPNQRGPEETGWRVTAQNLNLNRDYAKADAPETQAMLRLLASWDPLLYADLHVTDGAKFEHDVAVLIEPQAGATPRLRALGTALRTALFAKLEGEGHLPLAFYPDFRRTDDPTSGFALGVPTPRFQQGYWPLRNRFAALVETHSWRDYPWRVKTTRDVLEGLLAQAADEGERWREAAREADEDDTQPAARVDIAWGATEMSHPFNFRGYAFTREPSPVSGAPWIRYDETKPEVWTVPYYDEVVPTQTVAPPACYVVPAAYASAVESRLALHGFSTHRLAGALAGQRVQSFRAEEAKFRPEPYEGRLTVTVKGAWKDDVRDLAAGSLVVPVNQRGRALLLQLLEPQARDSFTSWGFFDAAFERKEYIEAYVLEPWAQELVARDAAVKEAFAHEQESSPELAKSAEARLAWFAKRHPSWDERMNLVPTYRLEACPR